MGVVQPFRRHGMDVPLPQDYEVISCDLNLEAVLRVEKNPITHLHGPDIWPGGHHDGPGEPFPNLGGGRGLEQTFLFGVAYAIASLSCALPIYLAAVGVVAGQSLSAGGAAETIIGSVAYGVGMGAVMMAATVGVVFFKGLVTAGMRKIFPLIEPIGNLAMVGAGAYLIYYWTIGKGQELLVFRAEQLF